MDSLLSFVLLFFLVTASDTLPGSRCVVIDECHSLVDLLKQTPRMHEVREFLNSINCGYTITKPKVWCKKDYKACLTPDGQEGTCETYKNCPLFLDRLLDSNPKNPEDKSYISNFECQYVFEPGVKVCCPDARPDTNVLAIKPEPESETPTLQFPSEAPPPVDPTSNLVLFTSPDLATSSIRPSLFTSRNVLPRPEMDECGKERLKFRITEGNIVDIDDFPWLAIVKYRNNAGINQRCQGVLINKRYVITAAHCVDESAQILESVILGEYDTRNNTDCVYYNNVPECASPVQEIQIEDVQIFPNRDEPFYHDIALVRLQKDAVFNDFVKPVCLPNGDIDTKEFTNYTIVGWRQTDNLAMSSVKQKIDIAVVPKDQCNLIYRRELKEEQLCLGSPTRDACTSDSGSPVMTLLPVNGNFIWHLMGIVSLGINNPCGRYPGVYTYIPPYIKWIKENVKD